MMLRCRLPGGSSVGEIPRACAAAAAVGVAGSAAYWARRHRQSAAVAAWSPSRGPQQRAGPLRVRIMGSDGPVLLLLHGMLAAGNSFGGAYDALAERATVVVPDLLGFGGSRQTPGLTDAPAHIAAIDAALAELGLQHRPTIAAGHSMGGVLALRWAATHTDRVRRVVTFGAPLYRTPPEVEAHVAGLGRMEALLAGSGPLPHAVCDVMCRYRAVAAWVAVACLPDLPVPIARAAVEHTWSTYSASFAGLIADPGWQQSLAALYRAGVPVTLAAGGVDPVTVAGRAAELMRTWPNIIRVDHPTADHDLPLTDPAWCRLLLADAVAG